MQELDSKQKLLIVDSMALLFRGYFATAATGRLMKTEAGQYTNGVYQFTRYLLNSIEYLQPSHVVCAFDMGKKTFRNDLYPEYKANRSDPPEELVPQFSLVRDLIEAFNIPIIGIDDFEADDVMGTLAKKASTEGFHSYLLTGDRDTFQLVDESTTVVLMKKGFGNYELITPSELEEAIGVERPEQVIDLKSLMGDPADNIPGCPGIGPKTAVKLLGEYGDLDNVYAHVDQLRGMMKERLIENRELVYLSRDLATIKTDLDFEFDFHNYIIDFDREKILKQFEELEFQSLSNWI